MATVEATVEIPAALAEVWDFYFDRQRWTSWVDGFAAVISENGYPETGGELVWKSTPAGRGLVRETVTAHEPRSLHRVDYEDPESAGSLETTFEMLPTGDRRTTRVIQRLTYAVTNGGPLGAVTDFLFIRSQMRRSLERSLSDLRFEIGHGG
jgi:uncharacterized protein YndB with AHSA1/START domain